MYHQPTNPPSVTPERIWRERKKPRRLPPRTDTWLARRIRRSSPTPVATNNRRGENRWKQKNGESEEANLQVEGMVEGGKRYVGSWTSQLFIGEKLNGVGGRGGSALKPETIKN